MKLLQFIPLIPYDIRGKYSYLLHFARYFFLFHLLSKKLSIKTICSSNDHQGFDISVHQSTSPVPESAGQLYGASGSNTNRTESSLHAKAKNQSHVGVADENRPKNGTSSLSLKEN